MTLGFSQGESEPVPAASPGTRVSPWDGVTWHGPLRFSRVLLPGLQGAYDCAVHLVRLNKTKSFLKNTPESNLRAVLAALIREDRMLRFLNARKHVLLMALPLKGPRALPSLHSGPLSVQGLVPARPASSPICEGSARRPLKEKKRWWVEGKLVPALRPASLWGLPSF